MGAGAKSTIQIPCCIDNASIYSNRTAYLLLTNSMLFKLINQTATIFEPKTEPPKNYDLPLPLVSCIIYVITSYMHDSFIIIIMYSND